MLHRTKDEATIHQNSQSCQVKELGGIEVIDGADVLISGRYPEAGYSVNNASSFVIRVLDGSGFLGTRGDRVELRVGDAAFIDKGEAYYFDGQNLTLFMASSPAWTPEQYSNVE